MTKLQAINAVLRKNGRHEVPELDTDGGSLASRVERVLDDEELRIQMETEWYYNTRLDVELGLNGYDEITVPTGTLSVDSYGQDQWRNVAQIGTRLYDKDNNTFYFDTAIRAKLRLRIAFECIPPVVREYIMCAAAARFCEQFCVGQTPGDNARLNILRSEENRARVRARRDNQGVADVNMLDSEEFRQVRGNRTRPTELESGGINQ